MGRISSDSGLLLRRAPARAAAAAAARQPAAGANSCGATAVACARGTGKGGPACCNAKAARHAAAGTAAGRRRTHYRYGRRRHCRLCSLPQCCKAYPQTALCATIIECTACARTCHHPLPPPRLWCVLCTSWSTACAQEGEVNCCCQRSAARVGGRQQRGLTSKARHLRAYMQGSSRSAYTLPSRAGRRNSRAPLAPPLLPRCRRTSAADGHHDHPCDNNNSVAAPWLRRQNTRLPATAAPNARPAWAVAMV